MGRCGSVGRGCRGRSGSLTAHKRVFALEMGAFGRMPLFMSSAQIGADELTLTADKVTTIYLLGRI